MDFLALVKERFSVRAYKDQPVEEEKLLAVLEAARFAPSAKNLQPFEFIVIHRAGREAELSRIYKGAFFTQAPLIIAIVEKREDAWKRMDGLNYAPVDCAIAMDHLILAATSLGLGTCWVAAFDPVAAREVLGLPSGVEPVAFCPLGYCADTPREKRRKPLSELVRYERY